MRTHTMRRPFLFILIETSLLGQLRGSKLTRLLSNSISFGDGFLYCFFSEKIKVYSFDLRFDDTFSELVELF